MYRKRLLPLHWLLAAALLLSQLGSMLHGLSHLQGGAGAPTAAAADAGERNDSGDHAVLVCKQCLAWAALDVAVPAQPVLSWLPQAQHILFAAALAVGLSFFRAAYRSRAPPRVTVSNT